MYAALRKTLKQNKKSKIKNQYVTTHAHANTNTEKKIREDGEEISIDKDHGEGLKSAKPMPEYLSILMEK
jgi:hypothetical protein